MSSTSRHSEVGQRQVGILLRNKPAHVAAFLGVLLGGGTVVVINPSRGDDRTRADIEALDLPFIVGEPDDLASLVPAGPTWFRSRSLDAPPLVTARRGGDAGRPGVAVRMLTSGTTGPPKRIDLTYDMLARSVIGPEPDRSPPPTELRQWCRDRQRSDGAHRRRLPRAAVRWRGKAFRIV